MAHYRLTNRADEEIDYIYEYSILNFGLKTAVEYVSGFDKYFRMLADNPTWGSDYSFVKPGLYRYEYRSHAIYYMTIDGGIKIICVLGNRQDPARHI